MDNSGDRDNLTDPVDLGYVPAEDWETVVQSVLTVSVDLVVLSDDRVVLTKRTNEPAKDEWFVPVGRFRKGEQLREAVHRVADEELGVDVRIEQSLSAYEHLYERSGA